VSITVFVDPTTLVTDHFALGEFAQRKWSGGPGLPYPADWVADRLLPLCEALEIVREALGGRVVTILSGYRSAAFNAALEGAARKSQHVQGRACDIRVAGVSADRVHDTVLRLSREGRIPQIRGLGRYPTFTHLDTRPSKTLARWRGGRTGN
jgi:uncharacterized protein YcbK (DUF882 family)